MVMTLASMFAAFSFGKTKCTTNLYCTKCLSTYQTIKFVCILCGYCYHYDFLSSPVISSDTLRCHRDVSYQPSWRQIWSVNVTGILYCNNNSSIANKAWKILSNAGIICVQSVQPKNQNKLIMLWKRGWHAVFTFLFLFALSAQVYPPI